MNPPPRIAKKKRTKRKINPARRAQIGEEKRARTREAVLHAAFELLGREKGLTTRIEEIITVAKVSRGTFYNYFSSMDDVFDALQFELNHRFNESVLSILLKVPEAAERAAAAIRFYLGRARQDHKWAWAMINLSAGGIIFGAETYRQAQLTVEEGIASGEFELTAANSGRDILLGTTLAAMVTQLRTHAPETYAIAVARHVLRGMGVAPEKVEKILRKSLPDPEIPPTL